MAKTKSELITETLQELGALGAGQSASTEDTAAVDARIAPLLQDLALRNVCYVGDVEEIPDEAFNHLVMLLAEACAAKFGRQRDAGAIKYAEDNLRIISRISGPKKLRTDCALRPRRRYGWTS